MELGSVGANSTLADCYPFMAQLLAQAFEADHHVCIRDIGVDETLHNVAMSRR